MNRLILVFITTCLLSGCAGIQPFGQRGHESKTASAELYKQYASSVTISRDAFGVPHVFGETDADAAFGFAYAQAEDNFRRIEENYLRASGRAAEFYGEEYLLDDWLNHSLDIVALAKDEYIRSSKELRAILDAYSSGLNFYAHKNVPTNERLLDTFEPWHALALIRYLYYQRGFLGSSGLTSSERLAAFAHLNPVGDKTAFVTSEREPQEGSNSWAANGKKSATGNALLFINPHLPYFGVAQVYEAHIASNAGWNFSGYTRFGFPMPYVGFNEAIGWASTDNYADLADVYVESFEDTRDPHAYRYGNELRNAERREVTVKVKSSKTTSERRLKLLRTHHGPVVGMADGKFLAVRMAKLEARGWLAQWHAMTKATDLKSFKRAASSLDMLFGNYLYADKDGNIFYVYNGAVPRRKTEFDWTKPVDGSNPDTEWLGYHTFDELPQVLNPSANYIQNSNGTPFLSVSPQLEGNPKPQDFPPYMVMEGDNPRSKASRRVLDSQDAFTLDDFKRLAFDTYVVKADDDIPRLIKAYEAARNSGEKSVEQLADAIDLLAKWDRRSTKSSTAMTLYTHWVEERGVRGERLRVNIPKILSPEEYPTAERDLNALAAAMANLTARRGDWLQPWGDIMRLQRPSGDENTPTFDDRQRSLPMDSAPTWAGTINTIWSGYESPDQQRRYGIGGHSYVAVVEFGPEVIAHSLHAFGASSAPSSPHFFDQGALHADHQFKRAWLTKKDVEANMVNRYHPGDE